METVEDTRTLLDIQDKLDFLEGFLEEYINLLSKDKDNEVYILYCFLDLFKSVNKAVDKVRRTLP